MAELSRQLCNRLVEEITTGGPISFDRYMAKALYEPGLGYYVNGLHKFGAAGDFVTAPEQGRLFAHTLSRQLDQIATELGEDWTLFELGAGSGALARDLLKTMECPPARYLILEPSAPLRDVQYDTLSALPAPLKDRLAWIAQPPTKSFTGVILANEVLDALPVARFRMTGGQPVELGVTVSNERLDWVELAPSPRLDAALGLLLERLPHALPDGYESEICIDLPGWLETITSPLKRGSVLFIDYGYPRSEYYHPSRSGGTLVCHYRHRSHFDPFVWPGLTDLSAFVDFTATAEATVDCGLKVAGYTTQAGFLLSLGLADAAADIDDDQQRFKLTSEIKRLTLPGEMGEKFKVIALTRDFDHPLTGFGSMSQLHRL